MQFMNIVILKQTTQNGIFTILKYKKKAKGRREPKVSACFVIFLIFQGPKVHLPGQMEPLRFYITFLLF